MENDIINNRMTPLAIRDEWTAYLEPWSGTWMFHIYVYKGSKSVLIDIKDKLAIFLDWYRDRPVFALLDPAEKPNEKEVIKHRKFLKFLNFELHSIVTHASGGHEMELYWIPNNGEI